MNGHPKNPCEHDTRTHTPAAPATEYTIEQIAEIDNRIRKERKAEREKVLDNLIAFHAGCYYDKGKDEHQSWVDSIKSLRGGGAP